ncbi:hypothetical protein R6Z07F_020133 [Ovis aries]
MNKLRRCYSNPEILENRTSPHGNTSGSRQDPGLRTETRPAPQPRLAKNRSAVRIHLAAAAAGKKNVLPKKIT